MAPPRLLIVDDSPAIIQVLSLTLADHFDLQGETNPCRAVFAAEAFRPDALLLDLRMPEMNGEEVARRFGAHPELRHCAILFMTGTDYHRPLPHPLVQKPFSVPALIETLTRLIAQARRTRDLE